MEDGFRELRGFKGQSTFEVASRLEHLGGLVFFDSAGNFPGTSQRPVSIISAGPAAVHTGSIFDEEQVDGLRVVLERNGSGRSRSGVPNGGLFGWVEYEGDFVFGEYADVLVHDELTGEWWENGQLSGKLGHFRTSGDARVGAFTQKTSERDFVEGVEGAKRWIRDGDIYQVNLSHAFTAEVTGEGSLLGLYGVLRRESPAPMACWMSLGDREILSSSPESFLRISGRDIETRPIKGTRPRHKDPHLDALSARELESSAKEAAELVMITDLLRNDLGQVAEYGSVEVTELLKLESLAQVHHLVSTVRGTLREEIDALSALRACFPGGSITGAPKVRAMEIIRDLEDGPRGVYCGALGWLGFNGNAHFNIGIRSLIREGMSVTYNVGAGIVADSDPLAEYYETLQKAKGIQLSLELFQRATADCVTR